MGCVRSGCGPVVGDGRCSRDGGADSGASSDSGSANWSHGGGAGTPELSKLPELSYVIRMNPPVNGSMV